MNAAARVHIGKLMKHSLSPEATEQVFHVAKVLMNTRNTCALKGAHGQVKNSHGNICVWTYLGIYKNLSVSASFFFV